MTRAHLSDGALAVRVLVGITTAATIFSAAGNGVVIGTGHLALGLLDAGLVLLVLELPHIPLRSFLDARRYAARFRSARGAQADKPHPGPGTRPRRRPPMRSASRR